MNYLRHRFTHDVCKTGALTTTNLVTEPRAGLTIYDIHNRRIQITNAAQFPIGSLVRVIFSMELRCAGGKVTQRANLVKLTTLGSVAQA